MPSCYLLVSIHVLAIVGCPGTLDPHPVCELPENMNSYISFDADLTLISGVSDSQIGSVAESVRLAVSNEG